MTQDSSRDIVAILEIQRAKARYFRGVDRGDGDLVRSILAPDCVLDYSQCCTDPVTGIDYLPWMNIIVRGRESWSSRGLSAAGIVSAHQGFAPDIVLTSDSTATAIWGMTDRLWMPPGGVFSVLSGYGHYHETYERHEGAWLLKTLHTKRIRVEVS